jgi:hypothetical protein
MDDSVIEPNRERWNNNLEYYMSVLGFAAGFGNFIGYFTRLVLGFRYHENISL